MTVKEFIRKCGHDWGDSSISLGTLLDKKERLIAEIEECSRKLNYVKDWKFHFRDKLLVVGAVLGFIVLVFRLGALPAGVTLFQPFISTLLWVCGGMGAVYFGAKPFLEIKNYSEISKLEAKKRGLSNELEECRTRIAEGRVIGNEIRKTEMFLKELNLESVMDEVFSLDEESVMYYMRKDMSLLSILYLYKRNMLPDIFSLLKTDEVKLKFISKKIDEKLAKNPQYFIMDENEQDNSQEKNTEDLDKTKSAVKTTENDISVRRSRLERNHLIDNVSEVTPEEKPPRR